LDRQLCRKKSRVSWVQKECVGGKNKGEEGSRYSNRKIETTGRGLFGPGEIGLEKKEKKWEKKAVRTVRRKSGVLGKGVEC